MQQSVHQLKFPLIHCPNNNVAKLICVNKNCNATAFSCIHQSCQSCQKNHLKCQTFWINALREKLQKKMRVIPENINNSITYMNKIYQEATKKIKSDQQRLQQQLKYYGLQEKQANLSEMIESNQFQKVTGKIVSKVLEQIQKEDYFRIDEQTLKRSWQKKKKNLDDIFNYYKRIWTRSCKEINSVITKDTHIINQFFEKPVITFTLLFRASEHNFDTNKFHQLCDGKENTIVIAETEHGQIIGGFTPLRWNSHSSYTADNGNSDNLKTFLFSITKEKKFTLKNPTYAICCQNSYGPTFGGGHDLYIANNANTTNSSYCNFGHSYQTNGVTPSSQQAYEYFSGSKSGYNVSFKEWQVFQLDL